MFLLSALAWIAAVVTANDFRSSGLLNTNYDEAISCDGKQNLLYFCCPSCTRLSRILLVLSFPYPFFHRIYDESV
jgi:hypothetical protein